MILSHHLSSAPAQRLPRTGRCTRGVFGALILGLSCSIAGAQARPQPAHHDAVPQDELLSRLTTARAARESRDPGAVASANSLVIASALRELAGIRSVEGAFPQAIDLYKSSLRFEQTTAAALSLATVEVENGQYESAIQLASQIHQADPKQVQADRILSSALMQKGDFVAAVNPLSRVAQASPSVENQYALANCLLQTKRPDDRARAQSIFKEIATEHGDSGSLHVLIGRAYRDAGDLPDAVQEFQRALEIDPRTPHAHYFLGLAKLSLNEWKPTPEADAEIKKEAELFPQDYLANYMTGFLASGERRYEDAKPFLQAAATLDPTAPEPPLYLGLNAYAQGNNAEAEPALRKAVALTGADEARSNFQIRRAYVDLGRILANSGRKDESEVFLTKARELQNKTMEQSQQSIASMAGAGSNAAGVVALAPAAADEASARRDETAVLDQSFKSSAKLTEAQKAELQQRETQLRSVLGLAYNDLGTSEAVQGHYPEAVGLYRKAEDWDASLPGLHRNLGQSEFRAQDYEGAISPLTQALLQEPGSRAIRAMLGIAYFDLNRFVEAAHTFAPLGADGMQDAQVGYAWAASLTHTGDLTQATKVLTAYAAQSQPPDVELLVGQLWTALGDYPRAISTFQHALAEHPALPMAHLGMGLAYLRSEQWPDAGREFQAELAIAPGNPDATYHLGYVYLQQNRVDDALRLFRQVVAAHPGYANAQYQLGKLELERGQVPEAITHLQAAEHASPRTDYIHYQLQAAYRKASRPEDAEKELAIYKQLKASAREQAADRVSAH